MNGSYAIETTPIRVGPRNTHTDYYCLPGKHIQTGVSYILPFQHRQGTYGTRPIVNIFGYRLRVFTLQ